MCIRCICGCLSLSNLDPVSFKKSVLDAKSKTQVSEFTGKVPTLDELKSYSAAKAFAPENEDLPKGVTVETVLDKDFSDWTAGTVEAPDEVSVGENEELYDKFFGKDSGWVAHLAYQAGGAMYLGYNEVESNDPGYFMTPEYDFSDSKVAYRFRVTAMNVNENSQDQAFQVFFMNQNPGQEGGQMISASALPMQYKEWTTCEWVGNVKSDCKNLRAMGLGWQGKVLVKNITFEKLIYSVATPEGITLDYADGKLSAKWDAVENAVSYKATAYEVFEENVVEIGSVTVADPYAEWEMMRSENALRYYVSVVACNAEEEESYPGTNYAEFPVEEVGDAEALPATNVTANGFTANWKSITDAARTMVFPTQKHKAAEDDWYMILGEEFQNVPIANDMYNPAMVIPMMGMGDMNMYMSRAGWSTDVCFFFRLMPEMPALVLSNMYAAYGMPGYVMSPVYDLSVGSGNVYISGMAMSAADDAVLTFSLVDAATGEEYSTKDVEVTTGGTMIEIELADGRPNSMIKFVMTDCAEEEMILIPMLSMSVEMKAGEEITGPLNTEFVAAPATSFDFEYPVDENNSYTYSVQGVFGQLVGAQSEIVEVKADGSGVAQVACGNGNVSLRGKVLSVINPDGEKVMVVSADGKVLASSSDKELTLDNISGVVLVKVGNKNYKFIR